MEASNKRQTSLKIKRLEDLQLQVQPRIYTGFPCIGLCDSPITNSVAKI